MIYLCVNLNILFNLKPFTMFKKIFLSLLTLGIYPIVSKSRKGKVTKVTKKYRDDGTLRKDVTLKYEYDDGSSPHPPTLE